MSSTNFNTYKVTIEIKGDSPLVKYGDTEEHATDIYKQECFNFLTYGVNGSIFLHETGTTFERCIRRIENVNSSF